MRKERSQYKVCGRLGYNARLRLWSGNKRKWHKRGRFVSEGEPKKVVNPVVILSNKERRGDTNKRTTSRNQPSPTKNSGRRRRKEVHGRIQNQQTGRKRRYGGVKGKVIRKDLQEQRKSSKKLKSQNERRYRKGRRRGEVDLVNQESQVEWIETSRGIRRGRVKQTKPTHRRARMEVRVDRRRWRSGRVSTLQISRDLIEHGSVRYVDSTGVIGKEVEWQGARLEVGYGRKVKDEVWKTLKGKLRELVEKEEYAKTAVKYREVDYVTGRRVLFRKVGSNEVVVPKGRNLSGWMRK